MEDVRTLSKAEQLKYEIAEEIGVLDKVFEQGWGALSSKESGKIGGLLAKKNKTHKSIQQHIIQSKKIEPNVSVKALSFLYAQYTVKSK